MSFQEQNQVDDFAFPHPVAEEAYDRVLRSELNDFEYNHVRMSNEEITQMRKHTSAVLAMSTEEYTEYYRQNAPEGVDYFLALSEPQQKAEQHFGATAVLTIAEELRAHEVQVRRMVNWVLHGLMGSVEKVKVGYVHSFEPVTQGIKAFPTATSVDGAVLAQHDRGEKRAPLAAAWRLGRLLTPEVVEAVVSTKPRLIPVHEEVRDQERYLTLSYLVAPEVLKDGWPLNG